MEKCKSFQPTRRFMVLTPGYQHECPLVEVNEKRDGNIIVTYTFPGFTLVNEKREVEEEEVCLEFHQVSISKAGYLARKEKPLLPLFGRYLQIPYNSSYEVSVAVGNQQEIPGELLVFPTQYGLSEYVLEPYPFKFERASYEEVVPYPEQMVWWSGPFDIDDYNALLIYVCPFQYDPKAKKLIGYGSVKVTVSLQTNPAAPAPATNGVPMGREAFGNLFLNPRRAIEDRLGVPPRRRLTQPVGDEFLIIHAAEFQSAAQKLAEWKKKRGLTTEVVCIKSIGNDPKKIKKYLRDKRGSVGSRLRYVLLLGDTDKIVPEKIEEVATDYYYATPDPTPECLFLLPWLGIGRIPVQADAEGNSVVDRIVDQIIAYEQNPPRDPAYYRRIVAAASFVEQNRRKAAGYGMDDRMYLKTIEDIRVFLVSLGFDVSRVYVKHLKKRKLFYRNGIPITDDVMKAFIQPNKATAALVKATVEGQLIIVHRDHGSAEGWGGPSFTVDDLEKVSKKTRVKGAMPSLFFSFNCLTGQFDTEDPKECFAEKLLRMNGTAPSIVAATSKTDTWLNNDLIKALFDSLFGGLLPTFPAETASYPMKFGRLGDLLNYGKCYLPMMSIDVSELRNLLEAYHVIGDPTLEVWKEEPRPLEIKATLESFTLDVLLSECPQGSVLTVWHGERMVKRIEPSSTHITISLQGIVGPSSAPGGPVFVRFWASGYRYKEVEALQVG